MVYDYLNKTQQDIHRAISLRMEREQAQINRLSNRITLLFSSVKSRQENRLQQYTHRLLSAIDRFVIKEKNRHERMERMLRPWTEKKMMGERYRLQLLEQQIEAANPEHILRRGYSITLHKGKTVKDAAQLKSGDRLETRLSSGTIHSVVE
mgnify:FL=1